MAEPLPLVLIPGLGCSARLYGAQITALWPLASITVANQTRDSDVAAVATRILADAPPRFALAGLSMGGTIAFEMVRREPERIGKLALLDTTPRPDTPELISMRRAEVARIESGRYGEVVELYRRRFLLPEQQKDERLTTIMRQMADETGADGFVRQLRILVSRPDFGPLLPSIRCATLVLVGAGDVRTPPEIAREMVAAITGARLCVVPECGHLSSIEQPERVSAALGEWLRS